MGLSGFCGWCVVGGWGGVGVLWCGFGGCFEGLV